VTAFPVPEETAARGHGRNDGDRPEAALADRARKAAATKDLVRDGARIEVAHLVNNGKHRCPYRN
jgi:hypothetical protein